VPRSTSRIPLHWCVIPLAPPMGPAAPDITERLVPLAGGPRVPSMDPRYPNNLLGSPLDLMDLSPLKISYSLWRFTG